MTDAQPSRSSHRGDKPGKTRTMWHPLLARLLDFALDPAFSVTEEISVGKMPLQMDILLVRRKGSRLSELSRRELSELVPLLNRFTLIEFKAPSDAMRRGDFAHLVGCSFLWHSKQKGRVCSSDVSLMVLAPRVNKALLDEVRLLECRTQHHQPGVFRVTGLPFAVWLIETDAMAEHGQPVLSLVSRVFLKDHRRIIEGLKRTGHADLVHYMVQQIRQFQSDETFAMKHRYSKDLKKLHEELLTELLEATPTEQRLRGIPPEERLSGLSLEEFAAGLSKEQAVRLRQLLEPKQGR